MTDGTVDVTRRGLLAAAAGGAAAAAVAGPAAAQDGPDFGGWFDDVPNYDGVVDMTGEESVTVDVGGDANNGWSFAPAAIQVDSGTEVVWEWTGQGGAHNVVAEEGADFSSGSPVNEAGTTYSQTFDSEGIVTYYCDPHRSVGMKAAVVVGDAGGGGGGGGGGGPPDYGDWFSDVPNFESTEDLTGQEQVSVTVGGDANNGWSFEPPAIHVDNGTEVVWEWSGEGGSHNVVAEEGADFESELTAEEGFTFSHTFEEDGIVTYYCDPHRASGMKAAVVVGEDYPTTGGGGDGGGGGGDGGGGSGPRPIPESAMTLGVATSVVMTATLGLAYVFIKYGGSGGGE